MSRHDDRDPTHFLLRYLAARKRAEQPIEALREGEGQRFRVVEMGSGRYGVVVVGVPAGSAPAAILTDRRTAFLAAAVFTAFGGVKLEEEAEAAAGDAVASDAPRSDEVREPAASWSTPAAERAAAGRLLAGLVQNEAALELLVQAVDPAVLAEARAIATGRMMAGNQTVH